VFATSRRALRGPGRPASSAIAAGLYLFGLLAFCEVFSRVALVVPAVLKHVAGTCDAAWRLRWVSRELHTGGAYAFDAYSPTRGWTLRSNVHGWRAFDKGVLNSNSHGLRGRREYTYDKPAGVRRIEVFGDSFTFGEEVGDDATFAAQLQRLMGSSAEVMNFGVHGYGHDQMLLYFREEGVRYQPDLVVLGFVDWDMERNLLEFRDFAKPRFDLAGDRLLLRNFPVPSPDQVLAAEHYRSRFVDLLAILYQGIRRQLGRTQADSERVTTALLDAFRENVAAAGAKLAIAYLPVEGELLPEADATRDGESYVAHYCQQHGVPAIDLRPAFVGLEQHGEHFRVRGHWNQREHHIAAEALQAGLRQARLLP